MVNAPFKSVQMKYRQRAAAGIFCARNFHSLKSGKVFQIYFAEERTIGKVDDDKKFIFIICAQKRDELRLVGVAKPLDIIAAQGWVLFAELNKVVVNAAQLRAFLGIPENI